MLRADPAVAARCLPSVLGPCFPLEVAGAASVQLTNVSGYQK